MGEGDQEPSQLRTTCCSLNPSSPSSICALAATAARCTPGGLRHGHCAAATLE
jgi:hypothetical protein